jgi:two-component system, chemotaxis family, CheB/CheR fusion protein
VSASEPNPRTTPDLASGGDEAAGHGLAFPVVGIAASAGGLEAFTELLEGLTREPGLAFLFVLHRGSAHKSLLPEILQKVTYLPVKEVTEGMTVEINHVYVIPPDTNRKASAAGVSWPATAI